MKLENNFSGIYKITNTVNGKCYIGSANSIRRRLSEHKKYIQAGKHHSIALQRAAIKYGPAVFEYSVLEACDVNCLLQREQHYFDTINPEYNSCRVAGSSAGIKHTLEQRKANSEAGKRVRGTPEWRAAQSARIKKTYMDNPELKKNISDRTRARMAAMTEQERCAKYTTEVRKKIGDSVKARSTRYVVCGESLLISEIVEKYGICRKTFLCRLERGWSVDRSATEQTNKKHVAGGDKKYVFRGEKMSLTDLAKISVCTASTLLRRLKAGMSVEEAVAMTPEQAEMRRRVLIVAGMKK